MANTILTRTSYRDPNVQGNPVRPGTTTHVESCRNLDSWCRPIDEIHLSGLHGWGVVNGFEVRLVTGGAAGPEVRVATGVAVDAQGRTIVLAKGPTGKAEVGAQADQPGEHPTFQPVIQFTDAAQPERSYQYAAMPLGQSTGTKVLTVQFWEWFNPEFDADGQYYHLHTPWLRLLDASQVTPGTTIVLAELELSAPAQVQAITQGTRHRCDIPAHKLQLSKARQVPGTTGPRVDEVTYAELSPSSSGGVELVIPSAAPDPDDRLRLAVRVAGATPLTVDRTGVTVDHLEVTKDAVVKGALSAGDVRITAGRLKNNAGLNIVQTDASDWLRINPPSEQYPAIALYRAVAIGSGGLSVGDDWVQMPANQLRVKGDSQLCGNTHVGGRLNAGPYSPQTAFVNAPTMEIGGPDPCPDGSRGGVLYLHDHGRIAHQLRYNGGELRLEAAGAGYGTSNTPNLVVGGEISAAAGGMLNQICIGGTRHGGIPYPYETIQLHPSNNLRFCFGSTQRMMLENNGKLSVQGSVHVDGELHASGDVHTGGLRANGGLLLTPAAQPDCPPMSGGQMYVGWNRSGGKGEITFTGHRNGGWVGGFDFWLTEGDKPIFQIRGDGKTIASAVVHPSDARGKEEVATLERCLDIVDELRGVSYRPKVASGVEKPERRLGVIAQEVERVLPELVIRDVDSDGSLAVEYTGLIPVLLEAVKGLHAKVKSLQSDKEALEARLVALESGAQAMRREMDDCLREVRAAKGKKLKS